MSVAIHTYIFCDECSENNSADDCYGTAKEIRAKRKIYGWVQIGSKDYCPVCVETLGLRKAK